MKANSRQTGLVQDCRFEKHDTGPGHPECPQRLQALRTAFAAVGLDERCRPIEPREATEDELCELHTRAYVDRLKEHCVAGARFIDIADSAICPASYDIARLAAGAILEATDAVATGSLKNAFCAVRPPGHHCESSESMGFCLFGNVALAARRALSRHGFDRVAVIDWDVHHGNGTQHMFEDTDAVFFCSLHGHPAYVYPGTGFAEERGTGAGQGATLNVPFYPGGGDDDFKRAFDEQVLPAMEDYKPQFVFISAGFDAHRRDPLAPLALESESYRWMTRAVLDVADRFADGRVVSVLEGGYDLDAMAESASIHLMELIDRADSYRQKR